MATKQATATVQTQSIKEHMTTKKTLTEKFMAARVTGTPLVSITCPDAEVTIRKLQSAILAKNSRAPLIQWDCVNGWKSRNDEGDIAIKKVLKDLGMELDHTKNPIRQLVAAERLPSHAVLFVHNAQHRTHHMERPDFWQALWNLRDPFKANFRTVVLLSPAITLPMDVTGDVLTLDEDLPTDDELLAIVNEIVDLTDWKFSDENKKDAATALRGLTPFSAEQAVAMALTSNEIKIEEIYERKRELLNDVPGLKVYSGTETFDTLGGCSQVKKSLIDTIKGKEPPNVIVFIDEGEKVMAGATHSVGDNTGISQDFMGTLLSYMEDYECDGTILVGPTGTAKSALAKAMGNEAKVPTVFLDLGGMKQSLVGASEHRIRYALKIIHSIGGGRVFFIMTSNNVEKIPPEFKRRFSSGVYFLDIPTKEERPAIWKIHTAAYGIPYSQVKDVNDDGWTGAEIRNCCRAAWRKNLTLAQAAENVVPVSESGAVQIRALRQAADGNFLSADYPGPYKYKV